MAHYLSSADVRKETGISRRQLARLAPSVPGAERIDGFHWNYKKSPALDSWIKQQKIRLNLKRAIRLSKDKAVRKTNPQATLFDYSTSALRNLKAVNEHLENESIEGWTSQHVDAVQMALKSLIREAAKMIPIVDKLRKSG